MLHAIVPERETPQAPGPHAVLERLSGGGRLERIHSVDVPEHEWQVEDAELLREFPEFRKRWRCKLKITVEQCLKCLIIVIRGSIRENFHAGRAVHLVVDALREKSRRYSLGMLVRIGDVAEFDEGFAVVAACEGGG